MGHSMSMSMSVAPFPDFPESQTLVLALIFCTRPPEDDGTYQKRVYVCTDGNKVAAISLAGCSEI